MVDLVTASALGSAVGPAIAASLSLIAPAHLSGTNTYWTIETAPGVFLSLFVCLSSVGNYIAIPHLLFLLTIRICHVLPLVDVMHLLCAIL
jgi:hypothetical protein